LFIGGLGDGFYTVPLVDDIVRALEYTEWSVFSVLLSSSYSGWGVGSLDNDIYELARCVNYVRSYKAGGDSQTPAATQMVVVVGHSTGSQDVLHYLHSPNPSPAYPGFERPPVDGAVLQAPVSDRESLLHSIKTGTTHDSPEALQQLYTDLVDMAKRDKGAEGDDTLLPLSMTKRIGISGDVPMSSRRFLSLASPESPGSPLEDDLFSSDLDDERLRQTFGAIGARGLLKKSLLVLPGEADEFCPPWVDKDVLLGRWETATKDGGGCNGYLWDPNSAVIAGAKHSPSGESQEEPRRELVSRLLAFLRSLALA
jgi:pimeloyl-ACP methyl ester carboxylesterase